MASEVNDQPKKISFGFSKIVKKPPPPPPTRPKKEEKIEMIECVEEQAIKVVGGNKFNPDVLVIPLKDDNSLLKNMIQSVRKRKLERPDDIDKDDSEVKPVENNGVEDTKTDESKPLSLDEIAAKELLAEANNEEKQNEAPKVFEVPLAQAVNSGESESTLDDYENVPINEFGLAMLRGMGWTPNSGIGKTGKLVTPKMPPLRPKGMGLGADTAFKMIKQAKINAQEDNTLRKGVNVKVIEGQHKNLYGRIEGLDDLAGRVQVRLTVSNNVVSLSEFMVIAVSADEYNKNSKVINIQKFTTYVDKPSTAIKTEPPEKPRIAQSDSQPSRQQGSRARSESRERKRHKLKQERDSRSRSSSEPRSRKRKKEKKSKSSRRSRSREHRHRSRSRSRDKSRYSPDRSRSHKHKKKSKRKSRSLS